MGKVGRRRKPKTARLSPFLRRFVTVPGLLFNPIRTVLSTWADWADARGPTTAALADATTRRCESRESKANQRHQSERGVL